MNSLARACWVLLLLLLAADSAGAKSFAYVANANSNNVSGFTINPVSGALNAVPGSPFAAGSLPYAVAADPKGKFVFVANLGSSTISAYSVDPATGKLEAVPGSPFAAGIWPESVAVDPTGRFLYVALAFSSTIASFNIDAGSGALTPTAGSPAATDANPISVAVDPAGKFVYAVTGNSAHLWAFTINATTGALTSIPGFPRPESSPVKVTVHPTGKFLYVVNDNAANVSAYAIDSATGALNTVPGSPFPAGLLPFSIAIDAAGEFAYVANDVSGTISAYVVDPGTGALQAVPGSPFPTGESPSSVAVDPTGRFLYATNQQLFIGPGNVSAFSIDRNTGMLSPVPGTPFPAGTHPIFVTTTSVNADTTAPTTTAVAAPQPNTHGWNNTDVTITFTATDDQSGSGVKNIQFALSGAENTNTQTVIGNIATVSITAEGATTLTYFATDSAGNQEAPKALIVRIDKTPPVLSGLPASGCVLWPVNHKMVQVATVMATEALSGLLPGSFVVTGLSSEPFNATSPDIVITPSGGQAFNVQLRAERSGSGPGRLYKIRATAADIAGNVSAAMSACSVPHDQRSQ